jgi:hypothetical protein
MRKRGLKMCISCKRAEYWDHGNQNLRDMPQPLRIIDAYIVCCIGILYISVYFILQARNAGVTEKLTYAKPYQDYHLLIEATAAQTCVQSGQMEGSPSLFPELDAEILDLLNSPNLSTYPPISPSQ